MALNCMRPSDGGKGYLMKNSGTPNESMIALLTAGAPHGLPGPCLVTGLHEFRAVGNARHPFYAVYEHNSDHEDVTDDPHFHHVEKKRRLTNDQVKSLEVSFETESKLEPERKNQLAQDLGLQPRQVAVWFQNRRARYKTKQLERDFDILKAQYDAVVAEKNDLEAEVTRLRDLVDAQEKGFKREEHEISQATLSPPEEETLQDQADTMADDHHRQLTPSLHSDDETSKQKLQEGELSSDSDQTDDVYASSLHHKYTPAEMFIQQTAKFSLERICNPQVLHHIAVKMEEGYMPEELFNNYFAIDDDQATMLFNWQNEG